MSILCCALSLGVVLEELLGLWMWGMFFSFLTLLEYEWNGVTDWFLFGSRIVFVLLGGLVLLRGIEGGFDFVGIGRFSVSHLLSMECISALKSLRSLSILNFHMTSRFHCLGS